MAERRVRFHPDAQRDLEDGLAFYSTRSLIAAERFLSEVEAALEFVADLVQNGGRAVQLRRSRIWGSYSPRSSTGGSPRLARGAGSQVLPGCEVRRLDALDVDVGMPAADRSCGPSGYGRRCRKP